jgi:Ni/Co efflux regulator RcnB
VCRIQRVCGCREKEWSVLTLSILSVFSARGSLTLPSPRWRCTLAQGSRRARRMWYSIVAVGPSGLLHSMRFPVELNTGSSEFSGFVAENYGGSSELKRTMMAGAADVLTVKGNNKLYLVEDWLNLMGWDKVYHRPRRHHAPTAAPIAVPAAVPTTAPAAALTTNNNHHHHRHHHRHHRPAHHHHHHRSRTRSSSCSAPSLASQSTSLVWVATATRRSTLCKWTRRARTPPTIVTSRQVSKSVIRQISNNQPVASLTY